MIPGASDREGQKEKQKMQDSESRIQEPGDRRRKRSGTWHTAQGPRKEDINVGGWRVEGVTTP
jgi:hypothetical protein